MRISWILGAGTTMRRTIMKASKSISWIWILSLGIAIFTSAATIAPHAFAAQVTLAWDPNTESDLAGYKIHYGSTSGSYSVHIDVHNVSTYTVTGLAEGQSYSLSAWSDEESFSTRTTDTDWNANGIPDAREVGSITDMKRYNRRDYQQTTIKSVKVVGTKPRSGSASMADRRRDRRCRRRGQRGPCRPGRRLYPVSENRRPVLVSIEPLEPYETDDRCG
jgi:hypothetical protein